MGYVTCKLVAEVSLVCNMLPLALSYSTTDFHFIPLVSLTMRPQTCIASDCQYTINEHKSIKLHIAQCPKAIAYQKNQEARLQLKRKRQAELNIASKHLCLHSAQLDDISPPPASEAEKDALSGSEFSTLDVSTFEPIN